MINNRDILPIDSYSQDGKPLENIDSYKVKESSSDALVKDTAIKKERIPEDEEEAIVLPNNKERILSMIITVLRAIAAFIDRRIKKSKAKRLAKRISGK